MAETDRELRHADIVLRYPGGLTPAQFRHETLASADEDGKLDPPSIADQFAQWSLLLGMWTDGLICRRCRRDEAGPWFITENGRAAAEIGRDPATTQPDSTGPADAS